MASGRLSCLNGIWSAPDPGAPGWDVAQLGISATVAQGDYEQTTTTTTTTTIVSQNNHNDHQAKEGKNEPE